MPYNKKYVAGLLIAALALALLYAFVFPQYGAYFPKCIFYTFTGLYCPGCGTQRALAALSHGALLTALHDNALAVVALPFILYSMALPLVPANGRKRFDGSIFYSPLFARIVLVTVLLFAILRNIHVTPFTLLAPL